MTFKEAFKLMRDGKMVKLPSWSGYWEWDFEKETIMMHCRESQSDNGKSVVDIRETQRVEYTMNNIMSDTWIEATEKNTPILGGSRYLDFITAARMSSEYGLPIKLKDDITDNAFVLTKPKDSGILLNTIDGRNVAIGFDELQSKEWEIVE